RGNILYGGLESVPAGNIHAPVSRQSAPGRGFVLQGRPQQLHLGFRRAGFDEGLPQQAVATDDQDFHTRSASPTVAETGWVRPDMRWLIISPNRPMEMNWMPTIMEATPASMRGRTWMLPVTAQLMPNPAITAQPMKLKNRPMNPNRCRGRLVYLCRKTKVMRSNMPLLRRAQPYLDFPKRRGRCSTTFSTTWKPFQFASTGM